jgi:ABC-2 type transport system permease protein
MSATLFASGFKKNLRALSGYALGMVFYVWLFIWVFPSFAGSRGLNLLLRDLPQGLLRVLGYSVGVSNLSGFLGGEFYSLLYLLIMGVYAVFSASRLMAHLIDNRSMAYLLASPVSRGRVATTQAMVLVSGVLVIGGITTAGGLLGAHWFAPHASLPAGPFLALNLVGILLFAVVAAYSFLFSCIAPDERSALGLSAAVTLLMYGIHVVGDLSSRVQWLAHLSLFTAFNSQQLIHGQGPVLADSLGLATGAIVLLAVSVALFQRRQLSL